MKISRISFHFLLRLGFVATLFVTTFATSISLAASAPNTDQLTIISPHRKSIQDEVVPLFKEYYQKKFQKDINISWLDQGGTENDLRFIRTKFQADAKTSGVDVFWGGGDLSFMDLEADGLLEKFALPASLAKEIPKEVGGLTLQSPQSTWYSTAISSFGIFYNKKILTIQKIPEPKTWTDLADKGLLDNLANTDPRHSATALYLDMIILKAYGWTEGWKTLAKIAGNTTKFSLLSSDPIKSVVSGEASVAPTIDFYATAKMENLGNENLGFVLPEAQTILNGDPIAILKGAGNRLPAERFVEFVLSPAGQKLLILPRKAPNGPKTNTLGRMAVNVKAYSECVGQELVSFNPFTLKTPAFKLDAKELLRKKEIIADLIGAMHVDYHDGLKKAWKAIIKRGAKEEDITNFGLPPVTEAEVDKLAEKWKDATFRTETMNQWNKIARERYKTLQEKSS